MGWFSWIAQNSNRSIIIYGLGTIQRPSRTCYLWDNQGRRWREDRYEGYGVFGGKDYFALLAEMNKTYDGNVSEARKRSDGLDLNSRGGNILYPNLTDCRVWTWRNEPPQTCAHQGGFMSFEEDDEEEMVSESYHKSIPCDDWENGKIETNNI